MKQLLAILMVTLFVVSGYCQEEFPPPSPEGDMPFHKPARERMEMMKIWKMTEFLDLSEEQAEKFFPRYKALSKELEEMSKQQREVMMAIKEILKGDKEIQGKEIDKIVQKASEIEKKKIDKKQEFIEGLGDVLTARQKAKYIVFEIRFKNQLREAIRHKRPGDPQKPHGRKRTP